MLTLPNGSRAVILLENLPHGHKLIKITKPKGWHKEGDILIW